MPGRPRRTTIATALLAAGAAIWAGPARAGLEICNETDVRQSVAIGYKGGTDWTSEGWWNIEPGDCATVVAGDLKKRYYYYFAESAGRAFESQDYVFCTEDDVFTIVGDTDCEARGFTTERFREIDTGKTATEYTLSLKNDVLPVRPDSATAAGVTGPGGERGAPDGTSGRTETSTDAAEADLSSGLAPGQNGTPFEVDALFQGCELEDGKAFCGFHAEGGKLRAFYGGPTPEALLLALEAMPVNTAVRLQGDRVGARDLQTAVVLRQVTPRPGGDPKADLRAALQGDWVSEQDRRIGFTIRGSELYTRFDGDFRGVRFLALEDGCAAAAGGPVLVQTKLKDRATACFVIERAGDGVLELTDPKRGARLRYVADR